MFKILSLKAQIAMLATMALLGILTLAGIQLLSDAQRSHALERRDQAIATNDQIKDMQYDFLNARRHEKDFLMRKDMKYAAQHGETMATMEANIAALSDSPVATDLTSFGGLLTAYDQQFLKLVADWQTVGLDEKSGLLGTLRASVHKVEEALQAYDDKNLAILMLMMRRHEKDFLARIDAKYVADIEARQKEFEQELERSSMDAAARKSLSDLIADYVASFKALAEIRLQLVDEEKVLS